MGRRGDSVGKPGFVKDIWNIKPLCDGSVVYTGRTVFSMELLWLPRGGCATARSSMESNRGISKDGKNRV